MPREYQVGDRVEVVASNDNFVHYCIVGNVYEIIETNIYGGHSGQGIGPIHRLRGLMNSEWGVASADSTNKVPERDFRLFDGYKVKPRGKVDEMAFFTKREQPKRNYKEV